jgi:hypothetical protein
MSRLQGDKKTLEYRGVGQVKLRAGKYKLAEKLVG